MGEFLRRAALPVIAFAAGLGFEIGGYESKEVAWGLWAVALLYGFIALVTWPPVRRHLPIPDYRISIERIRHLPSLDSTHAATEDDDLAIEIYRTSAVIQTPGLPVATIETSLRPSRPMKLERVVLMLVNEDGSSDVVDVIQETKDYLTSIFPLALERGGLYKWSFEIPPWDGEIGVSNAHLVLIADGARHRSTDFQVYRSKTAKQ